MTRRIPFTSLIRAPADIVWRVMLAPDGHARWRSAFVEGSYDDGSWEVGSRIRFMSPSRQGMVSEIAAHPSRRSRALIPEGAARKGVQ